MLDNLRAVLTRPGFAEAEIKVLRGIVSSLDYFSPRSPRGEGYPERKAEADREAHDDGDYRRKPAPLRRSPAMTDRPILMFDSGIGGLTVLREARVLMPDRRFVYVADDAGFPYGAWEEPALRHRMSGTVCRAARPLRSRNIGDRLQHRVDAGAWMPCATAFPTIRSSAPFRRSSPRPSGPGRAWFRCSATPGTVKRQYTRDLIRQWASKCHVRLVGSDNLAALAEIYMREGFVDEEAVRAEIAPCFVEKDGARTDIVVLACTHYPFLVNRMRKTAPWPVDWLDPAEAIARRALSLLAERKPVPISGERARHRGLHVGTGGFRDPPADAGFGLSVS